MTSPFTHEQQVLIEVANQTASLLGHHHHHDHHDHDHHSHGHEHDKSHGHGHKDNTSASKQEKHHANHAVVQKQFKAPQQLTTSLGLYALKKLQTIDPKFLRVKQARLLEPVTPGPITYYINAAFYLSSGIYATYLWRTRGVKGFASVAVIPFAVLVGARLFTMQGVSYVREHLYSIQRKNLVDSYTQKYGKQYLLSVLNPSFRL